MSESIRRIYYIAENDEEKRMQKEMPYKFKYMKIHGKNSLRCNWDLAPFAEELLYKVCIKNNKTWEEITGCVKEEFNPNVIY